MKFSKREAETSVRARPLSVEDRQASIIDAVIPLLIVHGRAVTSKQIAEAAGIAEGTIFRAFGDKESLIEAAIAKFLDPEPLRRGLGLISADLPLDDKVLRIVVLMQNRFSEIFQVMAAIGGPRQHAPNEQHVFAEIISEVLAPQLSELNLPAARAAHVIRLVTFAASFPHLNLGMEFSSRELANIVLYGIAGTPAIPTTESQG
ncbi:MAG: helix-turn-helix domain-containing protein [Terrimesophilobacter sp.]